MHKKMKSNSESGNRTPGLTALQHHTDLVYVCHAKMRASNVSHYTNSEKVEVQVGLNHQRLDSRGIEPRTTPRFPSKMLREYYTTKPQAPRGEEDVCELPVWVADSLK
ncbi:hypothetical protein F5Y14DRAFT_421285 [Nemania sp. NC0429]|nr:hypothetical protein F5Y14DRAFT_421285 [Nemania sp. NC0429]